MTIDIRPLVLFFLLAATGGAKEIVIPDGTRVVCRLERSISAANVGEPALISVAEDVRVDGIVVIARGSAASGMVTQRMGQLDFSIEKVRAAGGEFVPVRYKADRDGAPGSGAGVMRSGASVLFWPSSPFLVVRQANGAAIEKGIVLLLFTSGDRAVNVASAQPE